MVKMDEGWCVVEEFLRREMVLCSLDRSTNEGANEVFLV